MHCVLKKVFVNGTEVRFALLLLNALPSPIPSTHQRKAPGIYQLSFNTQEATGVSQDFSSTL
jgi:hypothetical protein